MLASLLAPILWLWIWPASGIMEAVRKLMAEDRISLGSEFMHPDILQGEPEEHEVE